MYLVPFETITKEDVARVGGKGANLGELTKAGIRVPSGAVLNSDAYRLYMKENQIDEETMSEEKGGSALREAIKNGELPAAIEEELLAFYRGLGKNARVAVRSSATAEDLSDASFAGQQETYLNVVGEEMLIQKVKECYASLWGDRAVSYRKKQGYDKDKVALAVVIQEMIESEKAGVIFTENPTGRQKNEILINASYGLGESVVSGLVTPDEYVLDRSGKLLRETIGTKETEIVYRTENEKEGTKTRTVDAARQKAKCLDEKEMLGLHRQALAIEAHYGHACDIEWAIRDGEVYILQARSITTLGEESADQGGQERSGETLAPITGKKRENFLFMLEKCPFLYYPLDADLSNQMNDQRMNLMKSVGIRINLSFHPDADGVLRLPDAKLHLTSELLQLPRVLKKLKNREENERLAEQVFRKNETCLTGILEDKIEDYDKKQCADAFETLMHLVEETSYSRFLYAIFPGILVSKKMEKQIKKVMPEFEAYDLLNGLAYKTAEINWDLNELARKLQAETGVKEAILGGASFEQLKEEFPQTQKLFADFLTKHGYKSDFNCYCLIAKTWNEEPDRFLAVLRPMLVAKEETLLENSRENGQKKYEEMISRLKRSVSDKKWKDMESEIIFYRFSHVFREKSQYLWEESFYACRRIYARLMVLMEGELDDTDYLKYLFFDELKEACAHGMSESLKQKIAVRKKKRPEAERIWNGEKLRVLRAQGEGIHGISGSSGTATGPACVVRGPEEFHKLKKGDILICHYTDPEWTPLFTLAAAVVSDTGGSLSHAAIVAREYGIPAVLGTCTATEDIKDGEMILADGNTGEVKRIE